MKPLSPNHTHGHKCTAAVICCMDFRFWKAVINYVQNTLGICDFDLITQAGAGKPFAQNDKEMMAKVETHLGISFNLHHAHTVFVVQHEDCGAYGGSKKFANKKAEAAFHKKELSKSIPFLRKKYKGVKFFGLYARFNDEGGIEVEKA